MKGKTKKIVLSCLSVLLVVCAVSGYFAYEHHLEVKAIEKAKQEAKLERDKESKAKNAYITLFQDKEGNNVRKDVSKDDVEKVEKAFAKIKDKQLKKQYKEKIKAVYTFIEVREEVFSLLVDGVLKSDTTVEMVNAAQTKVGQLSEGFKAQLQAEMDVINQQFQAIQSLKDNIASFYINGAVRDDIDSQLFQSVLTTLQTMPQKDIAAQYDKNVQEIKAKIAELEAIAKAKAEAERQAALAAQRAESERLARLNQEIKEATVIVSNVPLIDQRNGVLNGCEAASLLMGLQHFGVATNLSLKDVATAMPKHASDPHQGFIHDIFGTYPTNLPHWIAPDALAKFGQTYSAGVQNFTGATTDQLKAELDQGNPVIIYATYGFRNPTGYTGEVPNNLHVMLLVGYNKKTGDYIVNDPWGGVQNFVSAANFETQYNRMRFAVAIRP